MKKGVYLALSLDIPRKGDYYRCFIVEVKNEKPKMYSFVTDIVTKVSCIGKNVYRVNTKKDTYFVTVG